MHDHDDRDDILQEYIANFWAKHPMGYAVWVQLTELRFIMMIFRWIVLLLEVFALPLMFFSILYIIGKGAFPDIDPNIGKSIDAWSLMIMNNGPEVILPGCVLTAIGFWKEYKEKWLLALIYTTMSVIFLTLTILVVISFVGTLAAHNQITDQSATATSHEDPMLLGIRCIAGVLYVLIWFIVAFGTKTNKAQSLERQLVSQQESLEELRVELQDTKDLAKLSEEEKSQLQKEVDTATKLAHLQRKEITELSGFKAMSSQLQATLAKQEQELQATRAKQELSLQQAQEKLKNQATELQELSSHKAMVAELQATIERQRSQIERLRAKSYQISEEPATSQQLRVVKPRATVAIPERASSHESAEESAMWVGHIADIELQAIRTKAEPADRIRLAIQWESSHSLEMRNEDIASLAQAGISTVKKYKKQFRDEFRAAEVNQPTTDEMETLEDNGRDTGELEAIQETAEATA